MKVKHCSNPNCKQNNPQPLNNFHKDSHKKDGLRSRCKACELEAARLYREKHKEERAEKQRQYYDKHGDIQRAASREWKKNNKEHNKAKMAEWYRKNKQKRSEYNHEYGQEHHDGVLERSRKKRAKQFGLEKHFTEKEFAEKLKAYGYRCHYCGTALNDRNLTRDHYIPLVLGGSDEISNIVPCCKDCNSRKRNKMPDEFIKSLGNHEPSLTNGKK